MLSLILGLVAGASDRRLDPFQFNLCLWNLEGLDPIYSGVGGSRSDDEDLIAQMMYGSLSTCDMFVLPGLKNQTTAENLVAAMARHDFKDFERYPKDGEFDSTILSRVSLDNTTYFKPENVTYPIKGSTCGYSGQGSLKMSLSFYSKVKFHDPVPDTHVMSVRFKHGDSAEACAYREAQAKFLCETYKEFSENDHVFLAGSFEADQDEPYFGILKGCGFTDTIEWASGGDRYSRILKVNGTRTNTQVRWDMILVNQAVKDAKYIDQLIFIHGSLADDLNLTDYTYPMTLFVPQPLTATWKVFEISYSIVGVTAAASFFVVMLFCSRVKEENLYETIPEQVSK